MIAVTRIPTKQSALNSERVYAVLLKHGITHPLANAPVLVLV